MKNTDIQGIVQLGIERYGDNFKNYLENFPKLDYGDCQLNSQVRDLQYYEDTYGNSVLRENISFRESNKFKFNFDRDNIILTNGVTHGIYLCLLLLKRKGYKRVFIPSPSYSGYKDICEILDLEYFQYEMKDGFSNSFLDRIAHLNDCVIIFNTPHNPSGACLSSENIDKIKKNSINNVIYIFDCIYDEFIFKDDMILDWDDFFSNSFLKQCFVVNSFSKGFGLPGLRLGWVVSCKHNISKLEPILERNLICLNNIAQNIAITVLSKDRTHFKKEIHERGKYLYKELSKIKELECSLPYAGTTIMVRSNIVDVNLMIEYLMKKGVGLLPGKAYFGGRDNTFRLSFGYTYDEMNDFINEIKTAIFELLIKNEYVEV